MKHCQHHTPVRLHGKIISGRCLDDPRKTIAWCDGEWAGDPELVTQAQELCGTGAMVRFDDALSYAADRRDPAAVVAVIITVCRRRVEIFGAVPDWMRTPKEIC